MTPVSKRSQTSAASLALMFLVACDATGPAPPREPASAPAAPVAAPPLVAPEAFERDLAKSEAAASAAYEHFAGPMCRALRAGERHVVRGLLAPGATGTCVGDWTGVGESDLVSVRTAAATPTPCDLEAAFAGLSAELVALERCKLGVYRSKLALPGRDALHVTFLLELVGQAPDGRRLVRRGEIRARLALYDERWKAAQVEFGPLEEVSGRLRFHDVSGQVGIGLHRAQLTRTALEFHADARRLETIGGIAVLDLDRDGDDDLLAWNRLRTLQAFFNDGDGGFRRVHDLIPQRQVGSFLLVTDLDGDGTREAVSTEISTCEGGRARFGMFRAEGARWSELAGPAFAQDCNKLPLGVYEHVAVADVDRDGRLDLFFSGYQGPDSKKHATHNMFQASDGQPNVLFLQDAPLRFRPVVLGETAFSYAAAFLDLDDDGDQDLYVANDYGRNEVWRNDGLGGFGLVAGHPLGANGQSMGVTVADFDGDLDLDVYVSNMFSKAGSRIVPLTRGQVNEATYSALTLLARGNTLYRKDGPDQFSEIGVEAGVNRAGWAWGQAFFDIEGDGARSLYVVNGMTSHSDKRAPDF